ncbi:hypothetical protein [Bradyrhizobium sp. 23AC]
MAPIAESSIVSCAISRSSSWHQEISYPLPAPLAHRIESVFAGVRHKTVPRDWLSPAIAKLMVFKLKLAAAKSMAGSRPQVSWRKLNGGVKFNDVTSSKCRRATESDHLITQNPA